MKAFMIKWLLPIIMNEVIKALWKLANDTKTTIDDKAVNNIVNNKTAIINEIKRSI